MNHSVATKLAPPPPPRDIHESLNAYFELLDLGDMFLQSGMRYQLGPGGDIEAAYREWSRQQMETHTQTTTRMLRRLTRQEGRDG